MKIVLLDNNIKMIESWNRHFNLELVKELNKMGVSIEVICSDFNEYMNKHKEFNKKNCTIVSPANSFGMMDGGYDECIRKYYLETFNKDIIKQVQQNIEILYLGEQPIGTSLYINSFNDNIPCLIHTPTMRIPMNISNTNNVYMATKSVFDSIREFKGTIILPAFGGGCGRVSYDKIAYQMALAIGRFFVILDTPNLSNWNNIIKEIEYQG